MIEILLTNKISEKIQNLEKANNSDDIKLLRSIVAAAESIKRGDIGKEIKLIKTDNIFVFRLSGDYRLFYTTETKGNEKFILLLDFIKKSSLKSTYYKELKEVIDGKEHF